MRDLHLVDVSPFWVHTVFPEVHPQNEAKFMKELHKHLHDRRSECARILLDRDQTARLHQFSRFRIRVRELRKGESGSGDQVTFAGSRG